MAAVKRWLKENPFPLLLLLAGLGTRFFWISWPPDVVWDEQHFGRFVTAYLGGEYFFDIHPPLGKLMIYAPLKAAGIRPPEGFDHASSTPYPADYPYWVGRLPAATVGSVLPLLVYAVARALGFRKRTAFAAGALVVLDSALTAISRFTFIDVFLHAFVYAALLAYLHHRRAPRGSPRWWILLAVAGLSAGCAVSVKWTGAAILGVLGAAALYDAAAGRDPKTLLARAGVAGGAAAAIYVSLFAVHFAMLPRSGKGDAFHPANGGFRASLEGTPESKRPDLKPMGFVGKFRELNWLMYDRNANSRLAHEESSKPHEWISGRKHIWFWSLRKDRLVRLYLAANPAVWFFGTLALAGGFAFWASRWRTVRALAAADPGWRERLFSLGLLHLTWLAFFVPFLGIPRPMFLYHYFTALIASLLLGCHLVFEGVPAVGWSGKAPLREAPSWVFWVLLAAAAAGFLLLSPVIYGFRPWLQWQGDLLPLRG